MNVGVTNPPSLQLARRDAAKTVTRVGEAAKHAARLTAKKSSGIAGRLSVSGVTQLLVSTRSSLARAWFGASKGRQTPRLL